MSPPSASRKSLVTWYRIEGKICHILHLTRPKLARDFSALSFQLQCRLEVIVGVAGFRCSCHQFSGIRRLFSTFAPSMWDIGKRRPIKSPWNISTKNIIRTEQVVFPYTHVFTCNNYWRKGGCDFEREQDGVHGRKGKYLNHKNKSTLFLGHWHFSVKATAPQVDLVKCGCHPVSWCILGSLRLWALQSWSLSLLCPSPNGELSYFFLCTPAIKCIVPPAVRRIAPCLSDWRAFLSCSS